MRDVPSSISSLPVMKLETGAELLSEGNRAETVYFLASGKVEVTKSGVSIAKIATPGAVFGEMSILMNTTNTATVKAIEPSSFHVAENLDSTLQDHPELMRYIAELLARRLDALNHYLLDVKEQFKEYDDHMNMVDEVLDTLMHKHPRRAQRRAPTEP